METLIYLDTHVTVWLYGGKLGLFHPDTLAEIRNGTLLISPVVALELQYLFETDRISVKSDTVVRELSESIGLRFCTRDFGKVIERSIAMDWTRDPFDRLITAQAAIFNSPLLTKDKTIRQHYRYAFWD